MATRYVWITCHSEGYVTGITVQKLIAREFKLKVEQGLMGLFVKLGVALRIKPQNCLLVPLNLPPYCVQKVLLRRGAGI